MVSQIKMQQVASSQSIFQRKMKMKIWNNRMKTKMAPRKRNSLGAIAARKKAIEHPNVQGILI